MKDEDKREGINSMWEEVKKPHRKPPERQETETEDERWQALKEEFRNKDMLIISEFGLIDFSKKGIEEIVGPKVSYEEYLDAQYASRESMRTWFQTCYYEAWGVSYKGQIEADRNGRVCFTRIYVSGFYSDGNGFEGRENHVWMEKSGFESFSVGDCVSFSAEVYRYIKTGDGKKLDFGLRKPENIHQVSTYEIPSDDDLLMQSIDQMVCEVCMLNEQCYMGLCIANEDWRDGMRKMLWDMAKGNGRPDLNQET